MSFRCPQCGAPVSWLRSLWFIRIFSFPCSVCRASLALDARGRTTLLASIAAAVLVSAVVKEVAASETAGVVTLCAGIPIGGAATWRFGGLGLADEHRGG
jgi:hypothetical protein